jgi:hypothetical protein
MWSWRKPRSARVNFQKLWMMRPAPERRVRAKANSITTRRPRNPWPAGSLPSGCAATEDPGEQGCGQSEKQDGKIETDVGFGGDGERRKKKENGLEQNRRESSTENTADECQDKAFREELGEELRTRGAEGGADGDFSLTGGAAREEEIGDVDAGDEQDEGDRAHQEPETGDGVAAGEGILKRHDAGAPTLVGEGINFGSVPGDGIHVGVGLLESDAGFETTD